MTVTEFFDKLLHALLHAGEETLLILPFLYLTYLLREFLEHRAGERVEHAVRRAGRVGPFVGAVLGILPQCGFSAAAAGLYAGRVITAGTLVAVFLSTSDEMLPLLIAGRIPLPSALALVGIKALIAAALGFLFDLLFARRHAHEEHDTHDHVDELCRREGCHCEGKSIFLAALVHAAKVVVFIFLASFALGLVIELVGEESLALFVRDLPVLGTLLSALVGMIPNCAASVILTELYLGGALSLGSLLAGLLVGAGVGILVLFRTNRRLRENLMILAYSYVAAVAVGLLADLVGLAALLGL